MNKEIVFLMNSTFPYYSGGRETWLFNIIQRLSNYYKITVISYNGERSSLQFSGIKPEIEIIRISTFASNKIIKPFVKSYLSHFNQVMAISAFQKKCLELKKRNNNTVFISMDTIYSAIPLVNLKLLDNDFCFVCNVKGPHSEVLSNKFKFIKNWFLRNEIKSLELATDVWTNGRDTQDNIKKIRNDSFLVGNGVDIGSIDNCKVLPIEEIFSSNIFKICSVATLSDIKGVKQLIEASSILCKKGLSDHVVIFVGKGSNSQYKNYAEKLGVDKNLFFLGEKTDVNPYIKNSDLLTCLSGGGGMSMSALESLASKTPVIAWDSNVYRPLIKHNKTGYLVEPWNSKELADGIEVIMNNYDYYRGAGVKARESVEKYDWDNIVKNISLRIEEIC